MPTMQPDARMQELTDGVAAQVCIDLFQAYGVPIERTISPNPLTEGLAFCGVVGFAGPSVRGVCLLATTEGPLVDSSPVPGMSRDWMGELANQLIGRIKNRLRTRGVEFYVTGPVVVRGQHLAPLPRSELPPLAFSAPRGQVFVWVEVETAKDFRLSLAPSRP